MDGVTERMQAHALLADAPAVPSEEWLHSDDGLESVESIGLASSPELPGWHRLAARDPCDVLERAQTESVLNDALDSLDALQALVLRCRFGLAGEEPMTLDDVRARLALSRQRAMDIESAALSGLRRDPRLQALAHRSPARRSSRARPGQRASGSSLAAGGERASKASIRPEVPCEAVWSLEAVLDLAHAAGVGVVDQRGVGGRLWVLLLDPVTVAECSLADRLWRLGFDVWPGRGYCL